MKFEVPIRIRSEANIREHHFKKARNVKQQRTTVALSFRAAAGPPPHAFPLPATVTLTRIGPTFIHDDDNLISGFKAVRDQVAACCGWNDRDERIKWVYQQEKGKAYAARVEIVATPPERSDHQKDGIR